MAPAGPLPAVNDVSATWAPAYVGLGSNLDDPERQLDAAERGLAALPHCRLVAVAGRYGSDPVGITDQPRFLNSAAVLLTTLGPLETLRALRDLEVRLGKVPPRERNGPRRIDLDLLMHGDTVVDTPELQLPHPRLHERAFVLYPLAEIAPQLWVPDRGRVSSLRRQVSDHGLTSHRKPPA